MQFLQVAVAARALGPKMFGEYAVVLAVAGIGLGIAAGFVWTPYIKFSAGADTQERNSLGIQALLMGFLFYVLISLFVVILSTPLGKIFNNIMLTPILVLLPMVFISRLYYDLSRSEFLSGGKLGSLLAIETLFNLTLLLLFTCLLFGNVPATPKDLLLCHLIAGLLASGFGILAYRPKFERIREKVNTNSKSIYRFAAVTGGNSALLYLYSQADLFIAGLILLPSAVGIYAGARSLVRVGNLAIEAINIMSLATASTFVNQNKPDRLVGYIGALVVTGWCITIPIALLLFVGSGGLVGYVFGTMYQKSSEVVVILSLGYVFLAISNPTASALDAIGKPWIPLFAKILGLLGIVVTAYIAAGVLSSKSIAVASVVGIAIIAVIQMIGFWHETKPSWADITLEVVSLRDKIYSSFTK